MFSILKGMQKIADTFVFPAVCPVCRCDVLQSGALCPECYAQLSFMPFKVCSVCGGSLPDGLENGVCLKCVQKKPFYNGVLSAVGYNEVSRSLIFSLKYGARFDVLPVMSRMMAQAGEVLLSKADVLVPVPLHRRRLLSRRFNQSVLLAKGISKISDVPVDAFSLKRVKSTPKQGHLSPVARAKNVQKAFSAKEKVFHQSRVLLIDDVFTTGATVDSCAQTLKKAGAKEVGVLTFARVIEL